MLSNYKEFVRKSREQYIKKLSIATQTADKLKKNRARDASLGSSNADANYASYALYGGLGSSSGTYHSRSEAMYRAYFKHS